MNVFCYPRTLRTKRVFDILGLDQLCQPEFGVKAHVPLANGRVDRTEVDMRLGHLLVEAKLTELDFQGREKEIVESYLDFHQVFEARDLPREGNRYLSYQLIRNVLGAYACGRSFCVMADARRPDLKESWHAVMRGVRMAELRVRCKMITWQELSAELPRTLRVFLAEKYGIAAGDMVTRAARGFTEAELV